MSFPEVSIIIPVYNAAAYIDDCLNSICVRSSEDIEIICVDDCSTDNSLEVLYRWAEKDPRIKVIAQEVNTHQGGARNAGLDIARGKYVWFIDADDYVDEDAVDNLLRQMDILENADLISFDADSFIDSDGKKKPVKTGNIRREWPKNRKLFLPEDMNMIPDTLDGTCFTYFARRSLIDQYRFRRNVFFEDADFTFNVFTSPGVFYEMNYTPYHRRIRDDSSTGGGEGRNEESIKGRLFAVREIFRIIEEKHLPADHYGVRWAVKWFRFASDLYFERPELRCDECDQIILDAENEINKMRAGRLDIRKRMRHLNLKSIEQYLVAIPRTLAGAVKYCRKKGLKRTWNKILIRLRIKKVR